ncbi:MAG: ATP-binding cassette domain-containing protein, partial [Thermomonas sp.]|uniref:ABC transporter transmembrane domain-containing protein n=1 Tax=Thermomonas sp. TaxID=1971895 RepID=UPI001EB2B537
MNASDPVSPKARVGSLQALWPFMRRHTGLFTAWLIALACSSTATLSLPVAFRQMIDHGFKSGSNIDQTFGFVLIVILALALATGARYFFVTLLGEKVVADLRTRLYAHLLGLDAGFYDRSRSGELVSRLTADAELLRSVIASSMSVALRSSVTVIGSLVMMFVTSPKLAAWALLGIPMAVIPIILGARRIKKTSRASQDRIADANTLATEALGAVRTVQAHAREGYERSRYDSAMTAAVGTAQKRIGAQAIVTVVAISLIFGAVIVVLWSGAHDVIGGKLSAGALGQFVMYAMIGGGSVGALAEVWNELQKAAGGMGRIHELMEEQPAITAPTHPRQLPAPVHGEIHFDNVTFHYPQRPDAPALEGFSLHVKPGETVALVGPSGAGKSTVISMLLRFHDPDTGRILLDGETITDLDPSDLRSAIAIVPQAPVIFASSAADNIRYGKLEATDAEVRRAADSAKASEFLDALPDGFASELGERGA